MRKEAFSDRTTAFIWLWHDVGAIAIGAVCGYALTEEFEFAVIGAVAGGIVMEMIINPAAWYAVGFLDKKDKEE